MCLDSLAAIKSMMEAKQQRQQQQISSGGDTPRQADVQQLVMLQQLIPQVQALLDQHREQQALEQRQQQLMSRQDSQRSLTPDSGRPTPTGCTKCDSTKPLLAFMQKVSECAVLA